ncbi:MAG: hypothetical protein V7707_16780 [Motiliproteus sp.]
MAYRILSRSPAVVLSRPEIVSGLLSFPTAVVVAISLLLAGCGADKPSDKREYAVQGIYSGAISNDSRYAVMGSVQHGGSLWDIRQHERLYNWNHAEGSYSNLVATAISPESGFAVTVGQQDLVLWQIADGKPVWFWNAPAGILDAQLSANGEFALLGLENHQALYFDIQNGGLKHSLRHDGRVRSVDISTDGQLALTGSDDNQARLWDLENGELLLRVAHGNGVNTVALSPNRQHAFSAGQLDKALIWRTSDGQLEQTLTTDESFVAQRISYTAAKFSDSSDQLLTGTSSGLVQLWDVRKGTELRRWEAHKRDPFRPTSATIYGLGFGNGVFYALASNGFVNELK